MEGIRAGIRAGIQAGKRADGARDVMTGTGPAMPSNAPARGLTALARLMLAGLLVLLAGLSGQAHAQKLSLVRDAEIEGLIKDYTAPIFQAAGLGKRAIDVMLVNDPTFNAFVTDRYMFIHTGAIMQAETPNEIIGVIAHETGHIIGGHQARMIDRMEKAQALAVVGVLLGAGAMISGTDLGSAAGPAIIQGGTSSLLGNLLSYKREEETSADRAAITLLDKTGQSGRGMLDSFRRMGQKMMFSSGGNPFLRTHPLPGERVAFLEALVKDRPNFDKRDPESLQLRHDMARAKIAAYFGGMNAVRSLFKNNLNGPPARYGLAISQFLAGRSADAIRSIDQLAKEQPKNAYLQEMKAEILMRARKPEEALKPIQAAIKLDSYGSGLLRILHGHILLETGTEANLNEAVTQLKRGVAIDPGTFGGYALLARAYARQGNETMALAASAEDRFQARDFDAARGFAMRAQQNLKKDSPDWLRMEDIVQYKPVKKK